MTQYTEHLTIEGQRWDTVAYQAYGDAGAINGIIEANPTVPIEAVLPGGLRLLVPIVETVAPEIDDTILPPWK